MTSCPDDNLITSSMQVKIADLGVSNEFDGADALLTNTAGTPAFTGADSILDIIVDCVARGGEE